MKKIWPGKRLKRIAGIGFALSIFLNTCTSEYLGKWSLWMDAKPGASWTDFQRKYGRPRYNYPGWDTLPTAYQEKFEHPIETEDTYYAYQCEGLPSYWSFVVAVDTASQTVQRFIYWKAIALRPTQSSLSEN